MNGIINAISAFATWILSLVVKVFAACWDLINDVLIFAADGFFSALGALISSIPAPALLQNVSMQSLFNSIGSDVLFFFAVFQIGPGITLLGSAFAFRMARKAVTLFQW